MQGVVRGIAARAKGDPHRFRGLAAAGSTKETPMNTSVCIRNLLGASKLRSWLDYQLQFHFTRYGREIVHADVTMSDENGPRGGIDSRCRLLVTTRLFGTLSFVTVGEEPRAAFRDAVKRARTAVRRRLTQKQRRVRAPLPAMG